MHLGDMQRAVTWSEQSLGAVEAASVAQNQAALLIYVEHGARGRQGT